MTTLTIIREDAPSIVVSQVGTPVIEISAPGPQGAIGPQGTSGENLSALQTTDKSSLVAAINEVRAMVLAGGGGAGGAVWDDNGVWDDTEIWSDAT